MPDGGERVAAGGGRTGKVAECGGLRSCAGGLAQETVFLTNISGVIYRHRKQGFSDISITLTGVTQKSVAGLKIL